MVALSSKKPVLLLDNLVEDRVYFDATQPSVTENHGPHHLVLVLWGGDRSWFSLSVTGMSLSALIRMSWSNVCSNTTIKVDSGLTFLCLSTKSLSVNTDFRCGWPHELEGSAPALCGAGFGQSVAKDWARCGHKEVAFSLRKLSIFLLFCSYGKQHCRSSWNIYWSVPAQGWVCICPISCLYGINSVVEPSRIFRIEYHISTPKKRKHLISPAKVQSFSTSVNCILVTIHSILA